MKKTMLSAILLIATSAGIAIAQDLKEKDVPAIVKTTFTKKYPQAKDNKVSWEKEKGNYEANTARFSRRPRPTRSVDKCRARHRVEVLS